MAEVDSVFSNQSFDSTVNAFHCVAPLYCYDTDIMAEKQGNIP